MNKLKEMLNEIKEQKAMLAVNPEDVDPRIRNTFEGELRNATERLKELEEAYKNAVMEHTVVIVVKGSEAEEFASVAKEAAVALDYKFILSDIVTALRERNAPEPYDTNTHFLLLDELNKIKLKYNMVRLPIPQVNGYNDNVYGSDLYTAIDILFEKNYGEGLYSAVVRREIGKIALSGEFQGKKLPVFLYNHSGKVDVNFLPIPVSVIEINEKMDKEKVLGKIKELRSVINGNKKEGQE
jgi:hypothetical protein